MSIGIRRAGLEDAVEIAQVHISCWQETYADMMPAETLAALDAREWADRWRTRLADDDPAAAGFLAVDEAGAVVGLGFCQRQTSEKLLPLGYTGEISVLYLRRRIQRRGVGRRLLGAMAAHLLEHGCDSAGLWVFRDAVQARRFYEAHGAIPAGVAGLWEIYGMNLPDMAYGWRDLGPLAGRV